MKEIIEKQRDLKYWKKNAEDGIMTTPLCVLRYITELESELKTLESKGEVSEWISIKDKLPKYNANVLVCRPNEYSGNTDILIAKLRKANEMIGTEYGRGDGMGGGYRKTYKDYWSLPAILLLDTITHWMPLPKPVNQTK